MVPHLPQFLVSTCRLTQLPEQLVSPNWQDSEHLPAEQTYPGVHLLAQVPQLYRSVWVLTQVPEQLVSPLWQLS